MANTSLTYKWDNSQLYSDNFNFVTRYYDLGDTSLSKTIYQISMTFGVDNLLNVNTSDSIVLQIDYRTDINSDFYTYATYMATSMNDYTRMSPLSTIKRINF